MKKKLINNINFNTIINDDLILFQNKTEELLLKLKFYNENINFNLIDTNTDDDIINDINDINNIKLNSINLINTIDNIIIKLNKKIINRCQIRRKKKLFDLEFEFEFEF